MTEKNIAITPHLMQYMRDEGYDTGIGLGRERTIHGESWREWFCTKTDIDEVIRVFTEHDETLHYEGFNQNFHMILNGDWRLRIMLDRDEEKAHTNVWVRYRPEQWSWEKPRDI